VATSSSAANLAYTLASVSSGGVQGNDLSDGGSIPGDGSLVAFDSRASNLVAGDSNATYDVFVRNVATQQTTRVSTSSLGAQANGPSFGARISPDGTKVLFLSTATNLVPGAPFPGIELAYLKDLSTGTTSIVSASQTGVPAAAINAFFTRSGGSPAVVFDSQSTDVVPGTPDARDRLYLKNLTTGVVTEIPTAGDTGPLLGFGGVAATPDGAKLYYSYRNFNDTVAERTVYVRDMATGTTTSLITGNQETDVSSVSEDGSVVGLESYASDLAPNDSNGVWDAYTLNVTTRGVTLLSSDSSGASGNGSSGGPLVAPDGKSAVFSSDATNLIPGDVNGQEDLFRRDLTSNSTTLLSPSLPDTQNDGFTGATQFSSDGAKLGVRSRSSKLVPGDTNGSEDVFVLSLR
jgi:hypothetical protein